MAISYSEFDSTAGTVVRDIKDFILTNSDWTYLGDPNSIGTLVSPLAAGATSITFSATPVGLDVGSVVRIGTYASNVFEYRVLTAVTSTVITWSSPLLNSYAAATPIYWGNEVLRTTTSRGANIIFDLTGSADVNTMRLPIKVLGGWSAPSGTIPGISTGGSVPKYLYWKRTAGSLTNVVHCTVSISKEHVFIMIEGPRGSEVGAQNSSYGSQRNYFFIADLVPYSASDSISAVVTGGTPTDTNDSSIANRNFVVNISKSITGTKNWVEGKLLTLQVPNVGTSDTVGVQRFSTIEDEFYFAPYVVSSDEAGFRGRLNNIYNAGLNGEDNPEGMIPSVGAELTYAGGTYILTAVNKSDATSRNWGPLGMVGNDSSTSFWKSPIVAIPKA